MFANIILGFIAGPISGFLYDFAYGIIIIPTLGTVFGYIPDSGLFILINLKIIFCYDKFLKRKDYTSFLFYRKETIWIKKIALKQTRNAWNYMLHLFNNNY